MMAAMKIRHELQYDASPADVFAMLADPNFREKVCQAQKSNSCTVSIEPAGIEPSGGQMSVIVDQKRPSDGIPGFARKIVGDEIQLVQSEDWSDSANAALTVVIPGKPGRFDATITLTGSESGSVETIDGDLVVSIPLLSGKLEKLIAGLLDEALRVEKRVARAWLAGDR